MMRGVRIIESRSSDIVPIYGQPFAVLIDTEDEEWTQASWRRLKILEIFNAGCQCVVCYGRHSESLHDEVDKFIVEENIESNICTTFHDEENIEDVFDFLILMAMNYGNIALIISDQGMNRYPKIGLRNARRILLRKLCEFKKILMRKICLAASN